jgi:SAM-dependent methyltransferase
MKGMPNIPVLTNKVMRAFCELEDRVFDLRAGVQTGSTQLERASHQFGYGYQAAWVSNIRRLVRHTFALGEIPTTFIDVGCGKGRACFYAAGTGKFSEVLGIEVSETLVQEARLNLRSSRRQGVAFVQADATEYELPRVKSLVFMFNPFGAEIMQRFLERNHAVLRDSGSLLAYANDVERAVIERAGFRCRYRDSSRKLSIYQAD